jgi:hypothetical protein
MRLPRLRERTQGAVCAGAAVALLALLTVPTALDVLRCQWVREQLSGENWVPETPVEHGALLAVLSMYGMLAWAYGVKACQRRLAAGGRDAKRAARLSSGSLA